MTMEWTLLDRISEAYRRVLQEKLTGIYVHGSIAFGCFRWESSDIDFLVVVEEALTQEEKESLIRTLLELDDSAPSKGFEMSVVQRSACKPFADPTPFELHYSNAHRANYQRELTGTCQAMHGFDPDLAAHITVIRQAGIALCGSDIKAVFAPVPRKSYLSSLWYDIEHAPDEIEDAPVYYVLNLCRVLAYGKENLVLSKVQGGEWGMAHIPEERELIRMALAAYRNGGTIHSKAGLRIFAEKMLARIRQSAFLEASASKKD